MNDVPGASPPRDGPTHAFANESIRLPGEFSFSTPTAVVRPALAVLFRIAIGPEADRYVPRFLAFERAGHARPGWNWPAFLAPPVWAFYRRLWTEGIAFAVLPLAGAFAFAAVGASLDGTGPLWWLALFVFVWLFPSLLSSLSADALLWGRVRPATEPVDVTIQRNTGDGWKRITTTRTGAGGVFGLGVRAKDGARYRIRWTRGDGATLTGPPIRPR